MRKIAIKGDKIRGSEVLALLKMLGGVSIDGYTGKIDIYGYYIKNSGIIDCVACSVLNNANYKLYTIDEFWAEFPYKVGDKVHIGYQDADAEICGAIWDAVEESVSYACVSSDGSQSIERAEDLAPITETKVDEPINIAEILKDDPKGTKLYCSIFGDSYFDKVGDNGSIQVKATGYNPYSFNKYGQYNTSADVLLFPSKENRDWSTFKVKPQFPKEICDCGAILGITGMTAEYKYKRTELDALHQLIICRDAWWKVDNDWKPDWSNRQDIHYISFYNNRVSNSFCSNFNRILVFRTKKIRDKFFETFRELIEQCKELI